MKIISESATISPLADIEDSVRGTRIIIEDHVVIDAFVKIKPVGGQGDVIIGEGSYLNSGVVLYSGNGIRLGKHVLVAANCTFAATNHAYNDGSLPIRQQGFQPSKGGIVVGSDVWIGANTVLLDGVVIGDGCVIGAGSLVRGRLEPYHIYAGNPLKIIGKRGNSV